MGTFTVSVEIGDSEGQRFVTIQALVDTGATYTTLPTTLLQDLGVAPTGSRSFILADDRRIQRDVADTWIRLEGDAHPSLVVFDPDGAQPLLGAVTLETFGLAVDPIRQRLIHVDALLKRNA